MKAKVVQILIIALFFGESQAQQNLTLISANYKKLTIKYGKELPPDYPPINKFENSYDFIVIGGGSAGSVVANRLSEVPEWKVLLLEAGDQPLIGTEIPAAIFHMLSTQQNWQLVAERSTNFGQGFINGQIGYPSGRGLGGGSLINFMYATRCSPLDYDQWASQGNDGWAWMDVLPYFEKIEDYRVPNGDLGYHLQGGYLTIEGTKNRTISTGMFINGSMELGMDEVDFNGRQEVGAGYNQATLRDGRRCSTEKAYLRPAKARKNLAIVPNALVTKILIDPNNKTAYGVQVYYNKTIFTIFAKKEVILSAGAVFSPQLLMLSGVGPKEHLQTFGIPVINDLPVGKKLYDHPMFLGLIISVNASITTNTTELFSDTNMVDLVLNGDGPLAKPGGAAEALSFLNLRNQYPDLEFLYFSAPLSAPEVRQDFHFTEQVFNTVLAVNSTENYLQITPILLHPKSFGRIELISAKATDPPKVHTEFFTDPDDWDVNVLIDGIRYVQQLLKTSNFQKYNATLRKVIQPGCEAFEYDSDDYWRCCVRGLTISILHPMSTCKMGQFWDMESVVNRQLKVYGIERLRIIDASIMPTTLSGHTNLPTIMIGEKGADLIKKAHGAIIL